MKIYVIYDNVACKPIISFVSDNDKTALRDFGKWLEKVQEVDDFKLISSGEVFCNFEITSESGVLSDGDSWYVVNTVDCKKMAVERMEKAKEEFLSRVRADAQAKANHSQKE